MLKIVPMDKCPLDVIAEMGELTKNARIYLGKSAIEKLRTTADSRSFFRGEERLLWEATDKFPATAIEFAPVCEDWFKVSHISASDIAFTFEPSTHTIVISLDMAE